MKEIVFIIIVGTLIGILKYKLEQKQEVNMHKVVQVSSCLVMCLVLLGNSDDKISDALDYIEPSKHLDNIMERLHEQTGI